MALLIIVVNGTLLACRKPLKINETNLIIIMLVTALAAVSLIEKL